MEIDRNNYFITYKLSIYRLVAKLDLKYQILMKLFYSYEIKLLNFIFLIYLVN